MNQQISLGGGHYLVEIRAEASKIFEGSRAHRNKTNTAVGSMLYIVVIVY